MAIATPYGELLRVNPTLVGLLGGEADQLPGVGLVDLTAPEDRPALLGAWEVLRARPSGRSSVDCRMLRADGTTVPVQVTTSLVDPGDGGPGHLVLHVEDVSERVAMQAALRHLALHDRLTGLANRTLLADRLEQTVASLGRGTGAALLFLDLDRFKEVNDTMGHAAGDRLLVELARRLRSLLRAGDTAARLGGDEFTVLCPGVDLAQARAVADRVRLAAAEPFDIDGELARVSASIGVVMLAEGDDADSLLRDADTAMYAAKQRGRDRAVLFTAGMHDATAQRLRTEAELRTALPAGQLRLHYQPLVDLASGAVVGLEALVRWQHPERGLLLPVDFVPLSEHAGLAVALGDWVLAAAARQARSWLAAGSPTVWVNVSARQLQPGLVDRVAAALREHDLPDGVLGLEIPESALLDDPAQVTGLLVALRAAGVRLAIDDFGAGLSSLATLAGLPVDAVKVDTAVADRLGEGGGGRAVVAAALAVGAAQGFDTVVEGVDQADKLRVLRELGVPTVQGYHLGAPRPPDELSDRR